MATDRNVIARAADQIVVHRGPEVTVGDKGHLPPWRRGRGHRSSGEITFRVSQENGVPVLLVRIVEHSGDETRETPFEVFGTAALEVLEVVRELEGPVVLRPEGRSFP